MGSGQPAFAGARLAGPAGPNATGGGSVSSLWQAGTLPLNLKRIRRLGPATVTVKVTVPKGPGRACRRDMALRSQRQGASGRAARGESALASPGLGPFQPDALVL
jgi:hypothetical protein